MRCKSADIIGIRISSSKSEEGGEKTARKPRCLCLTFSSHNFLLKSLLLSTFHADKDLDENV